MSFCIFLVVSIVAGAFLYAGELPIDYRSGGVTPGAAERPDDLFRAAEARITAGTYDSEADALLKGTERFTKSIFNVPSLQFQRAVTERVSSGSQRGDVLVAEWALKEPFGQGSIVIVDTPYYSDFNLRLSKCTIASQADLTAFINTALIWHQGVTWTNGSFTPSAMGNGLPLTIALSSPPLTAFQGWHLRSPYPIVADFVFSGLLKDGDWFMHFGVGKSGAANFLGVPSWVPERFPPLSDLVKSWSFDKIRGEVGSEIRPFSGAPDFTSYRDRILIAELARRGLSQEQVIELLTDVQPGAEAYSSRYGAVTLGFQDAGKGRLESLYFDPVLAAYEHIGTRADRAVSTLFGNSAIQGCSSQVEAKTLEVLKGGVFAVGPLRYLQSCSTSIETITALERIGMPTEKLEDEKARTISTIRRHIDHPLKPRERHVAANTAQ